MFGAPEAQVMLLGVPFYYAALFTFRYSIRHLFPHFYASLLERHEMRKTLGLLVFPVGVLATIASAPSCAHAFYTSPYDVSKSTISIDAKVCLGTRAVLWTAELPLLGETRFYLAHHVMSLTSLTILVSKDLSLRPLLLIYAGLVTEIFSSSRAFMRGSGLHHNHPRLFRHLTQANAVSILFFRALPAICILSTQIFRLALIDHLGQAYFCSVALYTAFVSHVVYKLAAGFGFISIHTQKPAYLLLSDGTRARRISAYSLMLSAAVVATQIAAAVLYEKARDAPLMKTELSRLCAISLGTVTSGLFGARALNKLLSSSTKANQEENHIKDGASTTPKEAIRFFPWFNGLSIQGAILFSFLWLSISSCFGLRVNSRLLFGAVATSLPLGEAIGRLGCHFAGCCGSTRREKYPHIQLLSTFLNLVLFTRSCMLTMGYGTGNLLETGAASLLGNGIIRLVLNPLRSDSDEKLLCRASLFAMAQALFASVILVIEKAETSMELIASFAGLIGMASTTALTCRIAALIWASLAYQLRKQNLSQYLRIEYLVYTACVFILYLTFNTGAGGQLAQAIELFTVQDPLLPLTDKQFLASLLISAALPIVLLN